MQYEKSPPEPKHFHFIKILKKLLRKLKPYRVCRNRNLGEEYGRSSILPVAFLYISKHNIHGNK